MKTRIKHDISVCVVHMTTILFVLVAFWTQNWFE